MDFLLGLFIGAILTFTLGALAIGEAYDDELEDELGDGYDD